MSRKRREQLPLQPMPQFTGASNRARKEEILRAIDGLNSRIPQLSPGKDFSDSFLDIIGKAQVASDNNQWNESYRQVWNATCLINRGIESQNNRKLAIQLAFAPLATFAILAIMQLLSNWPGVPAIIRSVLSGTYTQYLWTGALGGSTIAWWGIVRHTILMDFDDQYKAWYWFKPLLGAIFGVVSVLIIQGGLLSLQGQAEAAVKNKEILHIIAFLAGFSERFFVRLIDRVMTALFGGESESQQARPPEAPQPQQAKPVKETGADEEEEGEATSTEQADKKDLEHPGLP